MTTGKFWTIVMGIVNCGISILGLGVSIGPLLSHSAGLQTCCTFLFFTVSLCFTLGCIYNQIKPNLGNLFEIRYTDTENDAIMAELDAIARKNFEESQRTIQKLS